MMEDMVNEYWGVSEDRCACFDNFKRFCIKYGPICGPIVHRESIDEAWKNGYETDCAENISLVSQPPTAHGARPF